MANSTQKQREAILKKQGFEPGQPGPLLLNIQTLIDSVGTGIPTTSKHFALPIRCLSDLNERLETPAVHKLKRPQLKSFPALAGLFLLLRGSGLVVGETKPGRIVLVDPEMLGKWDALNPTEQYMSLLDTWMTKANWSILGERDPFGGRLQSDTRSLYYQFRERVTNVGDGRFHLFYSWELRVAAALLEQFGWIKITFDLEAGDGKVADIRRVERTEFGDAMFATPGDIFGFSQRQEAPVGKALKHLFPKWENSLIPCEQPIREGMYTLKLSWSKIWRRIVVPATISLDDVTGLLLQAFDFAQDHLYQLEYRDRYGKEVVVVDPRIDDAEQWADEVALGDLPLDEGGTLELLYDFGDQWRFTITIESIDDSVTGDFEPAMTASHGMAPRQCNRDDDGSDDEDW